jgi:hypothetical protein
MLHTYVLACSSAMLQLMTSSLSHCPSLSVARERRVIGMLARTFITTRTSSWWFLRAVSDSEFKGLERKS